ncbi:PREDICTED: uncharacterized protein LOC109341305 [Lupinus angustifolius]|uniref:uncharacterized protein LOC109341305 n=1 Tax=Lupinus angustifolius TaxID=3871 RepID=UPI00092E9A7E|nr:PREDICTED: uncharacterized protein LOC109341305 [Lupinus angustifolius]
MDHLARVLQLMKENALFAKKLKCYFGVKKVKYLGHFISDQGVSIDPSKIVAVKDWPLPQTVKQLRGFLGLAGYCRRFIKGYGGVAKPLTELLKKDNLCWSSEAKSSFLQLKELLITSVMKPETDINPEEVSYRF